MDFFKQLSSFILPFTVLFVVPWLIEPHLEIARPVIFPMAGLLFAGPGLLMMYFLLSEEPKLAKRFGEDDRTYKKNVPRWIPRMKAYQPGKK